MWYFLLEGKETDEKPFPFLAFVIVLSFRDYILEVNEFCSNFLEEKQKRHLITPPMVYKILKENLLPLGLENCQ